MRAWQRDQQPEYTLTLLPTCPNDQDQLTRTITGVRWSGPAFFGLNAKKAQAPR
jgi:hypothetical protein